MDSHLLRFQDKQKYIVMDVESESLNLCQKNRPWNIAILECVGDKIVKEIDLYPWWADLKVGAGAAFVTGFTHSVYKEKATDAKKCLEILDGYLYNSEYLVIAHNGLGFDCYIHNIARKELGMSPDYSYIDRFIDTNSLAKAFKLGQSVKFADAAERAAFMLKMTYFFKRGLKTNLTEMGKNFGIEFPYDKTHEAIWDCRLNWAVWNKLKWSMEI